VRLLPKANLPATAVGPGVPPYAGTVASRSEVRPTPPPYHPHANQNQQDAHNAEGNQKNDCPCIERLLVQASTHPQEERIAKNNCA
jgi:hypothetical protein